jgi:hypothetical protein
MKTTLMITLTFIIATFSFGQIDNSLMKPNWKPGKENVIYGNTIMRVEGKNDIGGVTNIGYESFAQVKARIEKDADSEMWTPEKKNQQINMYTRIASGGIIHLYLSRLTIGAANTDMFTVIVKDSVSNEIYRESLKSDIPNLPSSGSSYWWNYAIIPLPTEIKGEVTVYVIDRIGSDGNSRFQFKMKL